jgi:hypothetical protein
MRIACPTCPRTGKAAFRTAPEAVEALRAWLSRDRDAAQDARQLRVYHCEHCHFFHHGRYRGTEHFPHRDS